MRRARDRRDRRDGIGMRRVRRSASLALAALSVCFGLSIAGCRQMNEKVTIAVISDPPAVTEGRLEQVWNGVCVYAYANQVQCGYYESGKTAEEQERTIRTAMNDRADVLVCVGEELADTVWSQQYHFGNKQFILFDGVPYSPVSGTRDVQRNTVCVLTDG
ncbi:MAG: BMP family ABC transporter substrate-binding protein, partial [Christensenellaceae bacterium]